jgi:hypothetical protein
MQARQGDRMVRSHKPGESDLSQRTLVQMPPHKERALWNFLTWSFFIAQVLAAEQFLGAQAKAAEDLTLHPPDPAAAAALSAGLLAAADATGNATEDPRSSPGTSLDDVFASPLELGQFDGSVIDLDRLSAERTDGSTQSISVAGYAAAGAAATATGDPGQDAVEVGPDLLDLFEDAAGPLLQTVEDVVATLDGILGAITDPLLGTAGNLVHALGGTVHDALAPVTALVDDLTQPVNDILALPSKLLDDTDFPIAPLLGATVDLAASAHDVLASAGHLAFPALKLTALDDLFTDGRYTEYNIELQAGATASAAPSGSPSSASSDPVADVVDKVADVVTHPLDDLGKHVSHILDDLALRGLGDGIS